MTASIDTATVADRHSSVRALRRGLGGPPPGRSLYALIMYLSTPTAIDDPEQLQRKLTASADTQRRVAATIGRLVADGWQLLPVTMHIDGDADSDGSDGETCFDTKIELVRGCDSDEDALACARACAATEDDGWAVYRGEGDRQQYVDAVTAD